MLTKADESLAIEVAHSSTLGGFSLHVNGELRAVVADFSLGSGTYHICYVEERVLGTVAAGAAVGDHTGRFAVERGPAVERRCRCILRGLLCARGQTREEHQGDPRHYPVSSHCPLPFGAARD